MGGLSLSHLASKPSSLLLPRLIGQIQMSSHWCVVFLCVCVFACVCGWVLVGMCACEGLYVWGCTYASSCLVDAEPVFK